MKKAKRVVVWFRQDLRLHDNEALTHAFKRGEEIVPIYVFDERKFQDTTSYGFRKTGKHRAKFLLESVEDLRQSFKDKGIDLVVRVGKPEDIIPAFADELKAGWVFCNIERTDEEIKVQDAVEKELWRIGRELYYFRGKMLYYTQDLPFPVAHTPEIFTQFRKEVERYVPVREPLEVPDNFNYWTTKVEVGEMPTLEDLGYESFEADERAVLDFKGGESAGLARLEEYLWATNLISTYKETRNGLIGGDYSSKFSPWLALGCLSPKKIYQEVKRYERERTKNKSTYWMIFELLWRDFFRLMAKKHKNKIFQKGGLAEKVNHDLEDNIQLFKCWAEGRTGVPFIDANMRELNLTGFMSNRGRQNVASFLVHDLKLNWQMGAEYFESMLIDYDVASNYCNWNYVAGVGNDPRENRYFNILSQAKRYDPNGEYVKLWLPELDELPNNRVHRPDTLSNKEQSTFHLRLGADYPKAMVSTSRWS